MSLYEKIVGPVTPTTVHQFILLLDRIKEHDLTTDEFVGLYKEYDKVVRAQIAASQIKFKKELSEARARATKRNESRDRVIQCKVCGKRLTKLKVNVSPSTMVGGGYKFVTICKQGCLDTIYY